MCALIRLENRVGGPDSAKFPVNFPVSREFGAETSSQLTASSANQSRLCGPCPARRKQGSFYADAVLLVLASSPFAAPGRVTQRMLEPTHPCSLVSRRAEP